ncbi:hypothetical protein T552_00438 [Pneumocystis carinii B80]|uniref:Uncharacterized protein n=1 Tax=Pneumocystis carinii (strain B80) TaxID=1408658 RepID=A0A0W4ZQS3_PNEC8|nr:hypothetical protein T552_00438 [Pneumocystis carinii B80]KTW30726.1 hypothetical protein T552_00438 [Pneumocystis carinii B80]
MDFQIRRLKAKTTRIHTQDEDSDEVGTPISSSFSDIQFEREKSNLQDSNSKFYEKKARKESKNLRLSFGLEGRNEMNVSEDEQDKGNFVKKKNHLRQESREEQGIKGSPLIHKVLESHEKTSKATPKYNSDYLSKLRLSTPSTPKEFCNIHKENVDIDNLHITEKNSQVSEEIPKILDEGIVKALKERRAEKREQNRLNNVYIPLEDDEQMILYSKSNESRLQREDDIFDNDGIEGIREYVDDKIILSKDLKRAQDKQKYIEMKNSIENIQNSDINEDTSEEESSQWEQTQIRKGVYGSKLINMNLPPSKKHQPIPLEIQTFENSINRLKTILSSMKSEKELMLSQIKTLISEKDDISKKEAIIKESLQKASQEYSNIQLKIPKTNSPLRGLDSIASYSTKQSPLSQTIL